MTLRPLGLAVTGIAAALAVIAWPQAPGAVHDLMGTDFPSALSGLAILLLAVVATWVLIVVFAGVAQVSLPGVPRALRAALFTGVAFSATVVPAHADTTHDLDGLPLPDRPIVTAPVTAPRDHAPSTVTVVAGDTLWQLAARSLPDDASAAQIAEATSSWHAANRDVIGPDPDLILLGQVLTSPDPLPLEDAAS